MSTKVKKAAPAKPAKANAKTSAAKPAPKGAAAPKSVSAPKATKPAKATKGKVAEPVEAAPASSTNEDEDEDEAMGAASSGGGSAAALAAASSGNESASFKNFRHHPDMENFYRFIFENDLRIEALAILNELFIEKANKKAAKLAGKTS